MHEYLSGLVESANQLISPAFWFALSLGRGKEASAGELFLNFVLYVRIRSQTNVSACSPASFDGFVFTVALTRFVKDQGNERFPCSSHPTRV
jgi:hypothetical protein